ncbi:MAG: hypothetical protein ACKOPT_11910, partial [Cyanobium sp.]
MQQVSPADWHAMGLEATLQGALPELVQLRRHLHRFRRPAPYLPQPFLLPVAGIETGRRRPVALRLPTGTP